MTDIIEAIFLFVLQLLLSIISWVVLLPAVMLIASPFILIISLFGRTTTYRDRVTNGYESVFDFWSDYGVFFVP